MIRPACRAAALLAVPMMLAAQTPAPPEPDTAIAAPVPSPVMLELALGPVGIAGGGARQPGFGLFIGAGWYGSDGNGGWRAGLTGSGANIGGPLPTAVTQGLVRTRNTMAITAERVRRWHRPGRAMTFGLGLGAGLQNADVERNRAQPTARESIYGWAPAVSAAADVAFTVPANAPGVLVAPLDLAVGVRLTTLVGAPRVADVVPVSGAVPAPRGVATMLMVTVGMRFGVLGEIFSLLR